MHITYSDKLDTDKLGTNFQLCQWQLMATLHKLSGCAAYGVTSADQPHSSAHH